MENAGDCWSRDRVLGSVDTLEEILARTGSSLVLARCGKVCKLWSSTSKTEFFIGKFQEKASRGKPGFLATFEGTQGERRTKLLHPVLTQGDATANALRARINKNQLLREQVLTCVDGTLLTKGRHGVASGQAYYYSSCLWDRPTVYLEEAPPMLPISADSIYRTRNTLGQFGLLPHAGSSGMSFFVQDYEPDCYTSTAGVSFNSSVETYVHLNVYDGANWIRKISPPYGSLRSVLFHRVPYTVISGDKLYIMYMVSMIVCYDLVSKDFSTVPLPADLEQRVTSWYDYTVSARSGGGLVLIHSADSMLQKFVMVHSENGVVWDLEKNVEMMVAFSPAVPVHMWTSVLVRELHPARGSDFYTVRVRKASADGTKVLMTLGFVDGFYEVDMDTESSRQINNTSTAGYVGAVYHIAEPWPPAV